MSNATVAVILALLGILLFLTFFMVQSLRASRAARQAAAAAEPGAPAPKVVPAMSRRDFFRRSLITSVLVFGAEFGAGTIAFLWPNLRGGFGSVIAVPGTLSELQAEAEAVGYVYNGAGRFYLVPWNGRPGEGTADYPAEFVTTDGLMPLYQRCVHLGCRVPFCNQSKWFECPCHGSKYNGAGEYQLGPAPRGLDRFKITVENDQVFVDTSEVVLGPPRGTNTIDQPPQGPYCVAAG